MIYRNEGKSYYLSKCSCFTLRGFTSCQKKVHSDRLLWFFSVLNDHSLVRILTVLMKVLVAGRALCLFASRLTSAVSSFGLMLLPFWPFLMFHIKMQKMFDIKMHKNLNLTVTQLLLLLQNKTAPQVVFQKKHKNMHVINLCSKPTRGYFIPFLPLEIFWI